MLPLLLLLAACPPAAPDPTPTPSPTPVELGPATVEPAAPCEAPTSGFARLLGTDGPHTSPADSADRSCLWMPGGVVASDLDGDGAHELLFGRPDGFPALYTNHELVDVPWSTVALFGRETLAQAAVDLDGDRLPDVVLVGEGFAASSRNLGGLEFAEPELLYFDDTYPTACINTAAFGDVDGDGDLDLFLPGVDPVLTPGALPGPELPWPGTGDVLLLQEDGAFVEDRVLEASPYPWMSLHALFTDRDDDGDLDLFVGSDRARDGRPGASFWRNDGTLTDDAPELGADIHSCVMGGEGWDVDRDGDRDYCFSDLHTKLTCLLNEGGQYVEGAASLGLQASLDGVDGWTDQGSWSPWTVEAVDVDNDGWIDVATAAGPPSGPGGVDDSPIPAGQPDVIWRGSATGFEDRSVDVGYSDPRAHYGLASADLHGDGYRELILGAWGGPSVLWDNPCGPDAWLEVALEGPPGNRQGFGAQVTLSAGTFHEARELHALRSLGQSAAELHFGLGDEDVVDALEVRWTDGEVTRLEELPSRARVTVRHPGH